MVLSIDRWVGKVAIVTGASAGIGAAIADTLVEEGLIVVGAARRSERIEERAKQLSGKKGKLYAFKTDVSKEEDILKLFEWTSKNLGPVHILINNAGKGSAGKSLTDTETEFWKSIIDINVLGLCVGTREAVKIMKENKINGHIFHINSIAGHKIPSLPGLNVYPASKHAVTALTETLRQELNSLGLKIKITSISPGYVQSEMSAASSQLPERAALFKNAPSLIGEDIADAVVYALSTPEHVQIHELIIKPVGEKF